MSYRRQIDLNGVWEFKRDPGNVGESEGWPAGKTVFEESMTVPGAPQAQGHGDPHKYQKTMFMEPFWIRRSFLVPPLDASERVWLRIGGILPAAKVYINGQEAGYTKNSRTPQRVDITVLVKPNSENGIAIKVCAFPEVRLDGLLEWNEGTQFWSGPYRPIYCEITDACSVVDAYIRTNLLDGVVDVDVDLSQTPENYTELKLTVKDGEKRLGGAMQRIPKGQMHANSRVRLRRFEPWSPGHPKLYTLEICLKKRRRSGISDKVGFRFGMREIRTEGTKFYLNGKPLYLRCFGDNHYYADTLCPPSDIDWYLPRLARAREYGMNAVKGCVEVIPPDYLEACDEAGILVIQEMPFGLSTLRANRYTIDERFREYYSYELDGIVRVSRNHACMMAYSMSSELSFDSQTPESFNFFSRGGLPAQTRRLRPCALWTRYVFRVLKILPEGPRYQCASASYGVSFRGAKAVRKRRNTWHYTASKFQYSQDCLRRLRSRVENLCSRRSANIYASCADVANKDSKVPVTRLKRSFSGPDARTCIPDRTSKFEEHDGSV